MRIRHAESATASPGVTPPALYASTAIQYSSPAFRVGSSSSAAPQTCQEWYSRSGRRP